MSGFASTTEIMQYTQTKISQNFSSRVKESYFVIEGTKRKSRKKLSLIDHFVRNFVTLRHLGPFPPRNSTLLRDGCCFSVIHIGDRLTLTTDQSWWKWPLAFLIFVLLSLRRPLIFAFCTH